MPHSVAIVNDLNTQPVALPPFLLGLVIMIDNLYLKERCFGIAPSLF